MRYIIKYLFSSILKILFFPLRVLPIKDNLIVFDAYNGKKIACNPYYIYVYLKEHYPELDLVWIVEDKAIAEGKDVKYVILNSFNYFYTLITAKVYIRNTLMPAHIPFRKAQIRIDTWHGGGAYKGTMYTTNRMLLRKKTNRMIASNTTWKVASCEKFIEYAHKDQLLEENKFIKIGMPRCDMFFNHDLVKDNSNKVRSYFGIKEKTYIVLYAPTYRSKAYKPLFDLLLDFLVVEDSVRKRFHVDNVLILFRGHHSFRKLMNLDCLNEANQRFNIIDTSDFQDTQAILCASDLLISDYSSIIWDFSFTYRPCLLFCPDLEEYISDYELVTPIVDWLFPLAKSNEELKQHILNFDEVSYLQSMKKHHANLGSFEEGYATERICDRILSEIKSI